MAFGAPFGGFYYSVAMFLSSLYIRRAQLWLAMQIGRTLGHLEPLLLRLRLQIACLEQQIFLPKKFVVKRNEIFVKKITIDTSRHRNKFNCSVIFKLFQFSIAHFFNFWSANETIEEWNYEKGKRKWDEWNWWARLTPPESFHLIFGV